MLKDVFDSIIKEINQIPSSKKIIIFVHNCPQFSCEKDFSIFSADKEINEIDRIILLQLPHINSISEQLLGDEILPIIEEILTTLDKSVLDKWE